jgi:hypothetical protein
MSDSDKATEETSVVHPNEETAVALPTPTSQSSATYYDDEVSIYLFTAESQVLTTVISH